jgi:hypothetical protein
MKKRNGSYLLPPNAVDLSGVGIHNAADFIVPIGRDID